MSDAAKRYLEFRERQRFASLAEFSSSLDFALDDFQVRACRAIESRRNVVVSAPTGSGKTMIAVFALFNALKCGERAFYTTPIKALSNQKYRELSSQFGSANVGLLTGDTTINPGAPLVVMTTEVVRNMIYRGADLADVGYIVLDEVHYLADRLRGPVWEEVIIHAPANAIIVALSATVRNAQQFANWIDSIRGHTDVITTDHRPVPLLHHMEVGGKVYQLVKSSGKKRRINADLIAAIERRRVVGRRPDRVIVLEALIGACMTPAIEFIFSRAGCEEAAHTIMASGIHLVQSSAQKWQIETIVDAALSQIDPADWSVLGINQWREMVMHGIGVHHAGMLPVMKQATEVLFSEGLLGIVYATETLALGINMPTRCVVIESMTKFDGVEHVHLKPSDFMQLGGRAGRRGIDDVGHVVVPYLRGATPQIVADLAASPADPLRSAFQPTYNMVVNLLLRTTLPRARAIMAKSFAQFSIEQKLTASISKLEMLESELNQIAQTMHCDRGDIEEYLMARQELNNADQEGNLPVVHELVDDLQPGAVVEVAIGRRTRLGVVIQCQEDPLRVSVVSDDGALRTFTHGILGIRGKVNLPSGFNARQPRERAKFASMLRERKRGGEFGTALQPDPASKLQLFIESHPVRTCPDYAKHMRNSRRYLRIRNRLEQLHTKRRGLAESLASHFDKVAAVLRELGYIDDNGPTKDGRKLAGIYAERDLLIAEAARAGVFDNLSAPVTAGAIAAIIYSSDGPVMTPSSRQLRSAIDVIETLARKLAACERRNGLSPAELPNAGIAQATFQWCAGRALHSCIEACDLAPGDFVRWMRSVIDAVSHLRDILGDERVDAIIKAIRRGVVAS